MDIKLLKKEILFRARRGMKEIDIAVARFIELHLEEMAENELVLLRDLLKDTLDQDLMAWLFDGVPAPHIYSALINKMQICMGRTAC